MSGLVFFHQRFAEPEVTSSNVNNTQRYSVYNDKRKAANCFIWEAETRECFVCFLLDKWQANSLIIITIVWWKILWYQSLHQHQDNEALNLMDYLIYTRKDGRKSYLQLMLLTNVDAVCTLTPKVLYILLRVHMESFISPLSSLKSSFMFLLE